MQIQNRWTKISKLIALSLVVGLTLTGCRKNPTPDNEYDPYISCAIPEMSFPQTTTNRSVIQQDNRQSLTTESTNLLTKLTILTLNDMHGSIEQNSSNNFGFSRVSTYINQVRNQDSLDDVVLLAAGDMFQGSALSNLTRGQAVIDVMNHVGFDAMTIGNHEFDWNINTILQYNDANPSNGEADFPILNSNIVDRVSKNPVTFDNPYVVIERENIRVGIIGLIGEGLESSIAASMVKDYEFTSPVSSVSKYAKILRNDELVDVVIALGHFDDYGTNEAIAALSGENKVDAIINGHGHGVHAETISRSGVDISVVEAGANAQRVGKIELTIDSNKSVTDTAVTTVYMAQEITPDSAIENLIANAADSVASTMNRVYGRAGENLYGASELYQWAPRVIQKGMGVDVGITNSGGLRSGAFPIYTGSDVKYRNLVALMPFDNYLVYMKLPGSFILSYNSNLVSVKEGLVIKNDSTLYRVAIVDYVADGNLALFGSTKAEYTRTNILLMDLFAYDVYVASSNGGTWKPKTNGASLSSVCQFKN